MGMFTNYDTICNNRIPNNLVMKFPSYPCKETKLCPSSTGLPYEEYNSTGQLIGYSWRQGETPVLEFSVDGLITVESNSLIFKSAGSAPTERTLGSVGQRAYNIVDFKSWTCTGVISALYQWVEDKVFTYPENSTNGVYLSAVDYLKDKYAQITLYNFRHEPLLQQSINASPTIKFEITREMSEALPRGIYYCSLEIFNESVNHVVFDASDGCLLVK